MSKKTVILISVCLVVLLAAGYVLFSKKSTKEESNVITLSLNKADSGDYASAKKILSDAISKKSSANLKIALAGVLLDEAVIKGNSAANIQQSQKILLDLEKKKSSDVYELLALSYELTGDYPRAIEYYEKAISENGDFANSVSGMGRVYFKKGEVEKASKLYEKAESLITNETENRAKSEIYAGLGSVSKDYAKAEEYFLKSIQFSSSKNAKAEAYANLVNIKIIQKDRTKAVEYAEKAVQENPESFISHVTYAKIAMSDDGLLKQNGDKVAQSLSKSILLAPEKAEPQYWQGKVNFARGETDIALKNFEKALSLVDKDVALSESNRKALKADINFDMAVAYSLKKDGENAKKYANEAIANNPVGAYYVLQNAASLKDLYELVRNQ